MSDLGFKFLAVALGQDGARALRKAVERDPALATVLVPRAIIGWLDFTTKYEYEGQIPGIPNSYVQFQKTEDDLFAGTISLDDGVYSFERSSVYHLAASIAMALGVPQTPVDPSIRDAVLVKLGKSIDTLAKAQVLMQELKKPGALSPKRMTTHGAYHIEHAGTGDRPYSVIHTASAAPVQTGISTLKDAQPIADWHQHRYGGRFSPALAKKSLSPESGYQITHEHHDLGDGDVMTKISAHKDGQYVGGALFTHRGEALSPEGVQVDPAHRRQGLASAMYAHAETHTGKKIIPSHDQTPMGQALWAGNAKKPQFGKVELPGQSHQPQAQQGPQAPTPPMKQPANAVKPPKQKPPSLSIGKSEAARACSMCGGRQFEGNRFKGCICWADLAKSVTTTAYGDGYVLTFQAGVDAASVRALMKSFREAGDE